MFLVAITALIVMVAGAIAVDLSAVATRGQSLQNAADSAALAGVQAYRASMGERTEATPADEAAAIEAVNDLLAQNGITDITPGIEFPDEDNDTEVKVTLHDDDAGFLLSGFTGGAAGTVERTATARFEACEASCIREVAIPPPFNGVDAAGDGDGYKPIAVGNALYSINHQSGATQGSLQITCVLRGLRHRTDREPSDDVNDKTQLCWDDASGAPVPGKTAYPSNFVGSIRSTPEMPHAAVVGTRIYWATSTTSAHYMFCFETTTEQPCSSPLFLNGNGDGYNQGGLYHRESHRGGGTVAVDDRIYTFTDDHKVHCVLPTLPMQSCGGYPQDTTLGLLGFPANQPSDGNHGSSIDRIVHDDGRIYSTLHIANGTAVELAECTSDNTTDIGHSGLRNAASSNTPVVIRSNTGLFIEVSEVSPGNYELIDGSDPSREEALWDVHVARAGSVRVFAFQSVSTGEYLVMSQEAAPWNEQLELASRNRWSPTYDYVYYVDTTNVAASARTSQITTYLNFNQGSYWDNAILWEGVEDPNAEPANFLFKGGDPDNNNQAAWKFHAPCGTADEADSGGPLAHANGTYLNCHDVSGGSCSGFSPVRLHVDGSSFSGRLFFHRNGAGDPTGVCSTGFTATWEFIPGVSYVDETELTCVTLSGEPADWLEDDMAAFVTTLSQSNTGASVDDNDGDSDSGTWGTWGDPHYNEEQNRLFYPTHRVASEVICWDFDSGSCGENVKVISAYTDAQDYGFISEGNCVFGLGHTANFYAFKADQPDQPCDTSSTSTWLQPCNCGGEQFWGSLEFDVTESQFEEFFIEIRDENDMRVYPPSALTGADETPPHDLLTEGSVINLSDYPVVGDNPQLQVLVTVKSFPGIDPWAEGEGSQTFTVEISRSPRLTD